MKLNKLLNIILNFIIVTLTIIAVVMMFNSSNGVLSSGGWELFKYFTVQSNVFMAITSIVSLMYLFRKDDRYPSWVVGFKLVGTTAVGITFFTVMLYLGPIMGYLFLLQDANLILHLLTPVIALAGYIILEPKRELFFRINFISLMPVTIYGIGYLINVAVNNDYGNVKGSDWYAFGTYGLGIGFVSLFGIILLGFLISLGLYFPYKKLIINKLHQ